MGAAIELVQVISSPLCSHCSSHSLEFDLPNSIRDWSPIHTCKNYWVVPSTFFFSFNAAWELSHLRAAKLYAEIWVITTNFLRTELKIWLFLPHRNGLSNYIQKNTSMQTQAFIFYIYSKVTQQPWSRMRAHVASRKPCLPKLTSHLTTSHQKLDCLKVIPPVAPIYYVGMVILKPKYKIFRKHTLLKQKCQTWGGNSWRNWRNETC